MPVMDGYEATSHIMKLIKSEAVTRKSLNSSNSSNKISETKEDQLICSIVALTAYTSEESNQRCINLGMKQILSKPVTSKTISEVIYKYVLSDKSKSSDQVRLKSKSIKAIKI